MLPALEVCIGYGWRSCQRQNPRRNCICRCRSLCLLAMCNGCLLVLASQVFIEWLQRPNRTPSHARSQLGWHWLGVCGHSCGVAFHGLINLMSEANDSTHKTDKERMTARALQHQLAQHRSLLAFEGLRFLLFLRLGLICVSLSHLLLGV